MGEAVDGLVGGVELNLEGVGRLGALLEEGERGGEVGGGLLDLDQAPGLAVADDDEVDLLTLLGPQVGELEAAQAEVGPALDGLEQVTPHERLGAAADVRNTGPVPEEPARLLAQRVGDVLGPGAEREAQVQLLQGGDPAVGGLRSDLEVAGELGEVELDGGALGQDAGELVEAGQVAEGP